MSSGSMVRLALVSDIHYAGELERQRVDYEARLVSNPLSRLFLRCYRRFIWLKDPYAHNHLLDGFLEAMRDVDWGIANGDYACDSAMVGVSDDAVLASAHECLGKLRGTFGERFRGTIGDHELGKFTLVGKAGGLRYQSWDRTLNALKVDPCWKLELGRYVLIGVASTITALPVFLPETLPEERESWLAARELHLKEINAVFESVQQDQHILLFCHDPSALPFLEQEPAVRRKIPQIERTIIGHLHTKLVLWQAQAMAGLPVIRFLGTSIERLSRGIHQASQWKMFRPLLCPSLAGIELMRDGGYYEAFLDTKATRQIQFIFHPTKR